MVAGLPDLACQLPGLWQNSHGGRPDVNYSYAIERHSLLFTKLGCWIEKRRMRQGKVVASGNGLPGRNAYKSKTEVYLEADHTTQLLGYLRPYLSSRPRCTQCG